MTSSEHGKACLKLASLRSGRRRGSIRCPSSLLPAQRLDIARIGSRRFTAQVPSLNGPPPTELNARWKDDRASADACGAALPRVRQREFVSLPPVERTRADA